MSGIPQVVLAGRDAALLEEAVALAARCPRSETAFAVGAVIADAKGAVLATGFSRELGDGWHAEEVALEKAARAGIAVAGATLYCSMEPCGARASRPAPCAEHILRAGLARVIFCLEEPPVFLTPKGGAALREAGLRVEQDRRLAPKVREANAHLDFEV